MPAVSSTTEPKENLVPLTARERESCLLLALAAKNGLIAMGVTRPKYGHKNRLMFTALKEMPAAELASLLVQ